MCLALKHEEHREDMNANNIDLFELGNHRPWLVFTDDFDLHLSHCQEKAAASGEMLLIISGCVEHMHLFSEALNETSTQPAPADSKPA